MSICEICSNTYNTTAESKKIKNTCPLCSNNYGIANNSKEIMDEIRYIQKVYNLEFKDALDVVRLCILKFQIHDDLSDIFKGIIKEY